MTFTSGNANDTSDSAPATTQTNNTMAGSGHRPKTRGRDGSAEGSTPTSREKRSSNRTVADKRKSKELAKAHQKSKAPPSGFPPKISLAGFGHSSNKKQKQVASTPPYSSSPERQVNDHTSSSSDGEDTNQSKEDRESGESEDEINSPPAKRMVQSFTMPLKGSQFSRLGHAGIKSTTTRLAYPTPSPVLPHERWSSIEANLQLATFDKTAVHDFVQASLFPKLKFVAGTDITMQYSTEKRTLCNLVMEGCNKEHSKAGMVWWETAKKQAWTEIRRLRNNATKNMKATFLGRCSQCI